jgi:hypothetical protein
MKPFRTPFSQASRTLLTVTALVLATPPAAGAATLNAAAGGTFTFSLDREALAPYVFGSTLGNNGYYLANFWNAAASDPVNPANTDNAFAANVGTTEISALNRVHELTPTGPNPAGQAAGRHVVGSTAGFSLDSATLAGVPITSISLAGVVGEKLGMTGIHGFYAPNWPGPLINGDFSLQYDTSRQTGGRSGWFIANNITFTMAVYDLANLSLTATGTTNWSLTGDLLMSPENAEMLLGASLADVGNFTLGVGSYAAPVPVPAAAWLFASGLIALAGKTRRKSRSVGAAAAEVAAHG